MHEANYGCDWLPRLAGGVPPRGDGDGYVFDSKGNPLFRETGVKAVQRMMDILPYCPPGTLSWGYGEVAAAMRDSKVALQTTFVDISFDFENPEISKVAGKLTYAHLPTDPGAIQTVIDPVIFMGINSASEHPKEAYEFLRWYVNEGKGYEWQFDLCPVISPDLRMREKYKAEWGQVYDLLEGDDYVQYHLWAVNFLEAVYKIYEPISMALAGRITADRAMDMAATEVAGMVKIME